MQSSVQEKKAFWREPANLFVIQVLLIYVGWKLAHHFLSLPSSGALYRFWQALVLGIGNVYAAITSTLLNLMGQHTVHTGIYVLFTDIIPGKRILVQEHCLAIPAMVIFTGAILLSRGFWRDKLWFIPMGLAAIVVINIARLIFLSLTFRYMSERFYDINHSYIYVALTYALILLLIWWWMKKYFDKPAMQAS